MRRASSVSPRREAAWARASGLPCPRPSPFSGAVMKPASEHPFIQAQPGRVRSGAKRIGHAHYCRTSPGNSHDVLFSKPWLTDAGDRHSKLYFLASVLYFSTSTLLTLPGVRPTWQDGRHTRAKVPVCIYGMRPAMAGA